jgi:ketosteroid isomerase-like protein
MKLRYGLVVWAAIGMTVAGAGAQTVKETSLFATVSELDRQLFDAYNRCDLVKLGSLVSDDLEFYHDQTGLQVGKGPFLESIQKNICGKVQRHLTKGSLEVHPLRSYGAVEIGSHTFTHPGEEAADVAGEAKFVMLWQQKEGGWKLTRVISYDHQSAVR